jgi:hypothetical protein
VGYKTRPRPPFAFSQGTTQKHPHDSSTTWKTCQASPYWFVLDARRGRVNVTKSCRDADFAEGISGTEFGDHISGLQICRNGWSCAYNVSYPPAFTNAAGSPQRSSNSPGFLQLNSAPLQFLTQPSASEQTMRADFPNAFFLDADIFRRSQLEIPIPGVSIPPYLIELLRHIENVRDMAASFFSDIYPWMPILSKSWFCNHLLNPLSPRRADSMLLLLSVRLITWFPSTPGALGSPGLGSPEDPRTLEDPRTPLYLAVKRFFLELETAGTFTLRHVQAGVLIGLYELGHAIYPAAYISVGVCARLAVALGFDKDIKRGTNTGLSWEQTEERRRVWWAILMLDR